MKYNPDIHRRKSIRLKNYDYSKEGIYFITFCTYQKEQIFGNINNKIMSLNQFGKIVDDEILISEKIRKELKIHNYVIMPNHIHLLIEIVGANGSSPNNVTKKVKPKSISSFVAGLKAAITTKINHLRQSPQQALWQRNYYDNIIRNDDVYMKVFDYIDTNPLKWEDDKYFE